MTDLQVVVLRAADLDPLDCWGGEDAIVGVLTALSAAGVPAEARTVRDAADLTACRWRPGLLVFPHGRRFARAEPLVAPLVAWEVPVVGSGPDGLAAENKARMKATLRWHGVPTPRGTVGGNTSDPAELVSRFGLPLVVKPVQGAESLGVVRCDDLSALAAALDRPDLLIEEWRRSRELTVAVLGNGPNRVAAPAEIVLPEGMPYLDRDTKLHRIVPTLAAAPDNDSTRRAVAAVLDACRVLGIHDWARVDVIVDRDGGPYVIDVNAPPGLRNDPRHPSYFPRCLLFARGTDYQDVVLALVAAAALRHGLPVPPTLAAAHAAVTASG
ncbi:MAG: ATP-grasp domain-containing protein [Pseudonocardiaceae bacterium]